MALYLDSILPGVSSRRLHQDDEDLIDSFACPGIDDLTVMEVVGNKLGRALPGLE